MVATKKTLQCFELFALTATENFYDKLLFTSFNHMPFNVGCWLSKYKI